MSKSDKISKAQQVTKNMDAILYSLTQKERDSLVIAMENNFRVVYNHNGSLIVDYFTKYHSLYLKLYIQINSLVDRFEHDYETGVVYPDLYEFLQMHRLGTTSNMKDGMEKYIKLKTIKNQ